MNKSRRIGAALVLTAGLAVVAGGSTAFASPHGGSSTPSQSGHHQRGRGPGGPASTTSSTTIAPTTSTTEVEVQVEDGPGHA